MIQLMDHDWPGNIRELHRGAVSPSTFRAQKKRLCRSRYGIDRRVPEFSARIEEYERLRSNLRDLGRRPVELTGEPVAEPEALPMKSIEDLARLRVDYLKSVGKL